MNTIREYCDSDWERIVACYPESYWEDRVCFGYKLKNFPQGCSVYLNGSDQMIGYSFGHPWLLKYPVVPLNDRDIMLPESPDCYYLHDIAVFPKYRGQGVGNQLFRHQKDIALDLGLRVMKLVAVLGSETYWERYGFRYSGRVKYGGSWAMVMINEGI